MAKLESAKELIALIESGKYENKVNAQRGAGRTRLPQSEKDKVFAFIESYWPDDGVTTKVSKKKKVAGKKFTRMAKKASKKVTRRASVAPDPDDFEEGELEETEAEVEGATEEAPKRGKKKASKKVVAKNKTPAGALPISPSEVKTVGDILALVDSTVLASVSVINALRQADDICKSGDITKGIEKIKQTLEGTANLLFQAVVTPLAHAGNQADPEVAARLEQVVAASTPVPEFPPPYLPSTSS